MTTPPNPPRETGSRAKQSKGPTSNWGLDFSEPQFPHGESGSHLPPRCQGGLTPVIRDTSIPIFSPPTMRLLSATRLGTLHLWSNPRSNPERQSQASHPGLPDSPTLLLATRLQEEAPAAPHRVPAMFQAPCSALTRVHMPYPHNEPHKAKLPPPAGE